MSRQSLSRRVGWVLLLCALCPGLLACSSQRASAAPALPRTVSVPTPSPTATVPVLRPERLLIAAIRVNAPIEVVGITDSGNLATPVLHPWVDTGWYSGGPLPGSRGSAVIDGHLDRPGGSAAVFWLLYQLRPGNLVRVLMSNGHTLRFRVTAIAYYQPQDAPLQRIFGDTSGTYLNLITCAGDWIPTQKQTTLRLVVYTKRI